MPAAERARVQSLTLLRAFLALLQCWALSAPAIAQPEAVASTTPVVVPFELVAGKVFVPVVVNGSEPQWFALDTGSPMAVIDRDLCKKLDLECTPGGQASGAGEMGAEMWMVRGASMTMAGIPLPEGVPVVAIDIDRLSPYSAHELKGLVGNDFLSSHVVRIDYQARHLTIFDPEGWTYDGPGQVVPVTTAGYNFIRAQITPPGGKPIRATFMIDTGAGLTVSLNTHFVNRHHFLDGHIPAIEASVGFGVGGEVTESVARFDLLRIGDLEVARPIVMLSQDQAGALAMGAMDGIIGGELLRRFTVTFDLLHRRMILEKNASFGEPLEFDMSGLTLRAAADGGLEVFRIMPGSPAAGSGLAEGDVIEAIDGNAVAAKDRDAVRELFKRDGQTRKLTIRRGDQHLEVEIALRRMV